MKRSLTRRSVTFGMIAAPFVARAQSARPLIRRMIGGLHEPWALAFLPGGGVLVTERGGRLLLVRGTDAAPVAGLPKIAVGGQGGLLDLIVAGDFASSRILFFSYAKRQGRGAGTALARARLSDDGARLEDLATIFEMAPGNTGGRHFGGRIAEAADGTLFLTLGERGRADRAQDLSVHNGKIVRIRPDGSVPEDNPFVGQAGARPEIWSLGHRNPQGLAFDAAGRLWDSEHGAMGGDEVNLVRPGANYGWPVIAYGRNYDGSRIGIGTAAPGMEQPAHYWDPSIAPSGHAILKGARFGRWQGRHLVGSLKFHYIAVLDPDGWGEERIEGPETRRVRDVREAPDGSIWFLSVGNGAAFRVTPA